MLLKTFQKLYPVIISVGEVREYERMKEKKKKKKKEVPGWCLSELSPSTDPRNYHLRQLY